MAERAIVPYIDPELAGIRDPFDRVLGWAGVLAIVALFLPIEHEASGAVWYWHLLSIGESVQPAILQALGGIALLSLSHLGRPRLDKAVAALAVVAVVTLAILSDPHASGDLLILFPKSFAARGLLFPISTALAAAAIGWRTGPFAGRHPRGPSILLAMLSASTALALLSDSPTTSVLVIGVAGYAVQASLQKPTQQAAAIGWAIGIPAGVIVTVGFKGAIAYENGALLLLGLRGAALFVSFSLAVGFSIVASLAQLSDPLGTEVPRPTRLLRDDLLYGVLEEALASGMLRMRRRTASYRRMLRRLVRRRFRTLLEDVRHEHPPPVSRTELLLRMKRQLIDDRDPVAALPPRVSRTIHFLGRGRNLELSALAGLVALLALVGLVRVLSLPTPEKWPLHAAEPWMIELYQRRLPRIGIASGGVEYAGRDRRLRRAVSDAAGVASPAPDLARRIEALAPLVIDVSNQRRALTRAIGDLNDVARDNGIPFYVDVDIVPVRRGGANLPYLYVKSYRIERVRHAQERFSGYTALWLSRVDRTSILDARLGWTRQNEHHGMIVIDVVRDYWLNDVGPALAGLQDSRVQEIYGLHRELLTGDLTRATAALLGLTPTRWRPVLEARLDCFVQDAPQCGQLAEVVDAAAVEILARKVEAHELQHVIDGKDLTHPAELEREMAQYSEEAITFAAAELSAYLAEVARSGQPRIALVHFLALAEVQPFSPEGFAGRVALEHLVAPGESSRDLLDLPERELSERARAAHERLFKKSLPPLIRTDA